MSAPAQADAESAEPAAAALAQAAAQGIHCLAIPTPFAVGRVNAYLIEDEPLTLIDSGPNSAKALDELEQALAARGHKIEDLELLVVTHQHIDHFGLAAILARRSGAQVAALSGLDRRLANFREDAELDDRFAGRIMLRHGVPSDVVTALRAVSASFRAWGCTVEVTRTLADGEELALRDRTLRVLHRPGHSPSDTVFWDERRSLLIAGDHLLGHISSNPLLARPLEAEGDYDGPRPQALVTYLASLERTRADGARVRAPGPRRAGGRPRGADRRARPDARAPREAHPPPDRRAPAHGVRDGARDVGQRRGHAGLSDDLRGPRARRPAA